MGDSLNYHNLGPPSINEHPNNHYNLGILYCGFFVVATAGLILAIYHCVALNCCTDYPSSWLRNAETGTSSHHRRFHARKCKVMELESSVYKYRKKGGQENQEEECVVCLSVFEEGEDVRKLVRCKHCFHAPCIDMWLYSHCNCPLCRAPVGGCDGGAAMPEGYSGAAFSNSGVLTPV